MLHFPFVTCIKYVVARKGRGGRIENPLRDQVVYIGSRSNEMRKVSEGRKCENEVVRNKGEEENIIYLVYLYSSSVDL